MSKNESEAIAWLLSCDEPVVRWWTLRDLVGRPAGDVELTAAQADARGSPAAQAVLDAQRPSGAWVKERHLYSPKHRGTHWQLDLLADFGFTAADEPVRKACDLFFHWQLPSGHFAVVAGAEHGYPCITGRFLCQLHRLGLGADRHTQRAWEALAATQRPDGGWHCRLAAMKAGTPSCFLATLKVLEACVAADWARKADSGGIGASEAVPRPPVADLPSRAATMVHDCLMERRVERWASPTLWGRFTYPNHWYDAIGVVDVLARFGYDASDARVAAAIALIREKRGQGVSWDQSGELGFSGPSWYSFGRVGAASPWVTFRALRALKAVGGMR
jgi:hypothetical protein